jgi:hypothetical protein
MPRDDCGYAPPLRRTRQSVFYNGLNPGASQRIRSLAPGFRPFFFLPSVSTDGEIQEDKKLLRDFSAMQLSRQYFRRMTDTCSIRLSDPFRNSSLKYCDIISLSLDKEFSVINTD